LTNPPKYDNIILEKEKVSVPTASALPSESKSAQQPKGKAGRFLLALRAVKSRLCRGEIRLTASEMLLRNVKCFLRKR